MFKPALCDTAVTHLITRQFLQHFHLRTGMAQHIHEIVYDHVDIVVQQVVNIIHQVETRLVVYYLGVRHLDISSLIQFLHLCPEQFFLMKVFAPFLLVVLPLQRKLFFNIYGQHSCKDRIAAILCGGRQYAVKTIFFQNAEALRENWLYGFPLVKTKIIYQDKEQGRSEEHTSELKS